jgi:hypothetical protein
MRRSQLKASLLQEQYWSAFSGDANPPTCLNSITLQLLRESHASRGGARQTNHDFL